MTEWASSVIYLLCLLTSVACAFLLIRSYRRTKVRLLLWSATCFGFLALNNLLVVLDIVVLPVYPDLSEVRLLTSAAGVLILLFGFIWEVD
jgi:hypothetical protein